jgi:hypothetical protein
MASNWFSFQEESFCASHATRSHRSLDSSLTTRLHRCLTLGRAENTIVLLEFCNS